MYVCMSVDQVGQSWLHFCSALCSTHLDLGLVGVRTWYIAVVLLLLLNAWSACPLVPIGIPELSAPGQGCPQFFFSFSHIKIPAGSRSRDILPYFTSTCCCCRNIMFLVPLHQFWFYCCQGCCWSYHWWTKKHQPAHKGYFPGNCCARKCTMSEMNWSSCCRESYTWTQSQSLSNDAYCKGTCTMPPWPLLLRLPLYPPSRDCVPPLLHCTKLWAEGHAC